MDALNSASELFKDAKRRRRVMHELVKILQGRREDDGPVETWSPPFQ